MHENGNAHGIFYWENWVREGHAETNECGTV